jgi:membrane-associated phospholipid phosphatase
MSTKETDTAPQEGGLFVVRHSITLAQTVLVSVATVVIIIVSSLIARDGTVPGWEESVLHFFNDWADWLEPVMWVLQQVGVTGAPILTAIVVYYLTRKWQYLVAFAAILPLKLVIEKGLIKNLVERERPGTSVGAEVNVRGPAFEGLSFPSGHTTTIFGISVLLFALLPPKWRIVPVVWAAIVAIARMYFGEHNLMDVVAGAATGTLFAVVLWYAILNRVPENTRDGVATNS